MATRILYVSFSSPKYLGILVAGLGIGVVIVTKRSFNHAETKIEPWKPTTKIISTGIYCYSRNPIYVAFCVVQIGIRIFINSLWMDSYHLHSISHSSL